MGIDRTVIVVERLAGYRRAVRDGEIPPDPWLRRGAWIMGAGVACLTLVLSGALRWLGPLVPRPVPPWLDVIPVSLLAGGLAALFYGAWVISTVIDPERVKEARLRHHKRVT